MFEQRSVYLTCAQVAERHGVDRQSIARLCRMGAIFPAIKHGTVWLIGQNYVIAASVGKAGRPGSMEVKPRHSRRGRPKGVKNSRPYPKGVKRPRRKPL